VITVADSPPESGGFAPAPCPDEPDVCIIDVDEAEAPPPASGAAAASASSSQAEDSFNEDDLRAVEAAEAAAVGTSENGPAWNPAKLANRNFGCEVLQARRCENPACPGAFNPIRGYFRSVPLSLEPLVLDATVSGAREVPSVQRLLEQFFADEVVEYDCERCDGRRSTIELSAVQLPRVLCLHIKRFSATGRKMQHPIQLERFLTLDFCTTATTLPPNMCSLTPATLAAAARATAGSARKGGADATASAGPAESPVSKRLDFGSNKAGSGTAGGSRKEREERELQRAIEASLREHKDVATMSEQEQLEWAMAESAKAARPEAVDETPWRGGEYNGGPTTPSGKYAYRLVSFIRHTGMSATSGHYIADVWNPHTNTWREYDDAVVNEVNEKAIFSSIARAQSAYLLFYCLESCLPKI